MPSRGGVGRQSAALLLDTAARACVDAQAIGTRVAVMVAGRMSGARAYQRLGYRAQGDYAREELGMTPRAFRDLARLGTRLEALPGIRAAFLDGELNRSRAEVICGVATAENEGEWLAVARDLTVRELKAAVRATREAAIQGSMGEAESDVGRNGDVRGEVATDDNDDEKRERLAFAIPPRLRGKIDSVLELAARVAGAALPAGTLWEFIAAEYLSGAVDTDWQPRAATIGAPTNDDDEGIEDPGDVRSAANQRQRFFEQQTDKWSFLPQVGTPLEVHGMWARLHDARHDRAAASPWELHRRITAALEQERRVAWQLGRLLVTIQNRRLWRDMQFASFAHYLSERLGMSSRAAQRLIRIDRAGWHYPALAAAHQSGELSPLQAEMLIRVFGRARGGPQDESARGAWITFAQRTTFENLTAAVRAVESGRADGPSPTVSFNDAPMFVADSTVAEGACGDAPMFVTGNPAAERTGSNTGATKYSIWVTDGERGVLEHALRRVRSTSHGDFSEAACLEVLLDHFLVEYDSDHYRELHSKYAVVSRDGWQCKVPGCRAYHALQVHHIVYRSRGGGDEPENLITLCDFHHKALHEGWIKCAGRAPNALYWELGVDVSSDPLSETPIARIAGRLRLRPNEYWNGARVKTMDERPAAA